MWTRKHVLFGLGVLIVLEVCGQLLLPYERAVPLAMVGPVRAGFSTRSDLARIFQEQFEIAKIEIKSGDRVVADSLPRLGMTINSDQMAARLVEYPLWQRLIPFSVLWKQPRLHSFEVTINGTQIATRSEEIAGQLSYQPINASVELKDGKVVVGAAKPGNEVSALQIRNALQFATYYTGTNLVTVQHKEIVPTVGDGDIAVARQQATDALSRSITLAITGKSDVTPDANERASWLTVDMSTVPAKLSVNKEKIAAYVGKINDSIKVAAQPTTVTLVDGIEQARAVGKAGQALDMTAVSDQLAAALLGDAPSRVVVSLQSLAPALVYSRSYTSSQTGLQAYVAYATSTQNVRIVVQQLDGSGWSASGRADESIPSASTYKLYVMLRVFDDINSGALTWDTPMLDTTVGGCFERTIVPSTNPCAEEWIRQYGRDTLNDYVHDKGFSNGTGFRFSDATHTTAGDLAKYLVGLHNGSLVSGNNRDLLLEKMGRQLYRYGIPTGTKGWAQDKVGFLWDYIHDAAIVHNPKGTYVLVIMTKGYSYGYIANVAKQIDTILYP